MKYFLVVVLIMASFQAMAKRTVYRKTQSVDFDGADVDGVARNPDGAYLMQRRGLKFMPMYKVKSKFDKEIKESVDYLR